MIHQRLNSLRPNPKRRRICVFLLSPLLVAAFAVLVSVRSAAQPVAPTEYQIKAAFIYNFARFVEWPQRAFESKTSPLNIGVLGEDPFGGDLQNAMKDKVIDEHPLIVKSVTVLSEAANCQILFIGRSEKDRLPQILASLKNKSVLTVSEIEQFSENGGIITFVREGTKIRFQINNDTAGNVGLKISAKLLAVAVKK